MEIYLALNATARRLFVAIANVLRIDSQFLLDLTDINLVGSEINDFCCEENKEEARDFSYSSSLLSIYKYVANINGIESIVSNRPHHVVFGAHTDSSFLTIGLLSSTPGLQIVDQSTNQWVSPEAIVNFKD